MELCSKSFTCAARKKSNAGEREKFLHLAGVFGVGILRRAPIQPKETITRFSGLSNQLKDGEIRGIFPASLGRKESL